MEFTEANVKEWYGKVRKSKVLNFFWKRNAENMRYLNVFTLHFIGEKKYLEKQYHIFHNQDATLLVFLCAIIAMLIWLLYILLDLSFSTFHTLLIVRLVAGGVIGVGLIFLGTMRFVRRHVNYFASAILFGTIVGSCYTLILRNDTDFSPFYMALIWINMHFPAYFLVERAASGFLTIILYNVIWIAVLHSPVLNLLNTQTLTYVTFYIGSVLSAYSREVASRSVYLKIHDLIPIVQQSSSTPSTPNLSPRSPDYDPSSPSSSSSSPPLSPLASPSSSSSVPSLTSSEFPLLAPSSPSSPSDPSSLSLDPPSTPPSPTLARSSVTLSPSPSLSFSPSPSMSNVPTARKRDWLDDFTDQMNRATADCFPVKSGVTKEVKYHKEVFKYVRMHSYRFTRWFCDPVREEQFGAWHLVATEVSVRRFFVLNAVSAVLLVLHDISFDMDSVQLGIVLALRFGAIVPSLVICFVLGSLFAPTVKWRVHMTTVLLIICSVTSFAMGLLIWQAVKHKDEAKAKGAYELYTGVFTSYIIYGFSGMGLRWLPSTVSGVSLILISIIVGAFLGFSLSFYSILVAAVGFTIAFSDEITMRTEFMLTYYRPEIITYLQGKTLAHMASLPASPSSVSVSLDAI